MKNILSVFAGLAVAIAVFLVFEHLSLLTASIPAHSTDNNEAVEAYIAKAPVSSFLWVLAGYVIGSFLAGLAIKLVSKNANKRPALIVGTLLTIGGVINFYQISHPTWFVVLCLISYIPMVLAGFSVVKSKPST